MKGELTIEENTVALQEMKKGSAGDLNNGKEDEPELVALNTDSEGGRGRGRGRERERGGRGREKLF